MTQVQEKVDLKEFLSAENLADANVWVDKYPAEEKQSAVMAVLRITQEQNGGYLTVPLMDAVGDFLDMPHVAVYEVATFYTMYIKKPCAKNKLYVCTNISCMLRGSEKLVDHLEKKLDIKMGETTADNKITLMEAECLGACCGAPVAQVNKDYHENLDTDKLDAIIDGLE